jgi:SGNH hydrolase-like domain, acetyltransferase AlgX
MHRPLKIALIAVFLGTLWLVGLQVFWPVLPVGAKLKGVTEEVPEPKWAWTTVRHGELFRAVDQWYDNNVGLRNFWVRLDNQVSFSLFREVAYHGLGTQVVAGEHDWLFERHYITNAVTPGKMTEEQLQALAHRIRSVQDKLARLGVPFLLVVAPNKAEVYPEHAPAAYLAGRQPADILTNYKRARPIFREAGVHFYDGPGRYDEWKRAGTRDLFARSGTHWSYDSAFRVLQEIRELLNPQMRHLLPELKLTGRPVLEPQLSDTDLILLLNLLHTGIYEHPLPYSVPVPQILVPDEQLPRLLWVHDSFGFVLIDLLYSARAVQPSHSLYYFENEYSIPGYGRTGTEVKKIDWKTYLKSYDAVIMVWTDIAFEHQGWGFFEALERSLD